VSAARPEEVGAADAEGLLAVSASVGWPHRLDEWHGVLESARVFGHRDAGGELISSGAVFPFGASPARAAPRSLAAIGMIIVKPEHQGRGLARAMMDRCLTCLGSPAPVFMLIATPQGRPLYEQLRFEVVDHVQKLVRAGVPSLRPAIEREIVPLDGRADDVLDRLDADAFGADRRRALAPRIRGRRGGALLRRHGTVVGFGLSSGPGAMVTVGPVIAPDSAGAAALILHLAEDEASVRIDVPVGQQELIAALVANGFQPGDVAPVMLLGGRRLPGRRARLFATASRAIC
jgi:GNAT superfamily N-acetyltransferase